jgi:hypothetical protein
VTGLQIPTTVVRPAFYHGGRYLSPYFCAKVGGFYSVMQTGGISNRRIRRFSRKMANIWYHQKNAFDLAKTKELSDDRRIWPNR